MPSLRLPSRRFPALWQNALSALGYDVGDHWAGKAHTR
jgi:hypothetical protein